MFHKKCTTTTFTSKNIFFVHIFQKNQSRIIFLVFLCTYVQFWIQLCHNLCQKLLHCMEPYTYSPLKINLLTGNNGTTTINYTKKKGLMFTHHDKLFCQGLKNDSSLNNNLLHIISRVVTSINSEITLISYSIFQVSFCFLEYFGSNGGPLHRTFPQGSI